MAQTLGTLLIDVKSDTTQLIQGFNRAESAVNKTTKNMGTAIKTLAAAYVSLEAVDLAKGYAKQVDELTNVNNRLKLATKTSEEFASVQKELFNQAQNTRSTYAGTIDLYGRIAKSTQNLALSQKELLNITHSINKAMIVGGGSAESQQAALIQLGQAFSSNFKAVGQELGSIREQAPRLYEAMIKGTLETNKQFKALVDNGAEASGVFKKWAEDGKLSSEIVINALRSQGVVINSEFDKMIFTIEQSMLTAKNSIQKLIYDFDQTSGISKNVADSIRDISKSIDSLDAETIAKVAEGFKDGAIAVATMYASIKATSVGFNAYNTIMQKINETSKANIEIEAARAKAISLGEQAVKARRLADEALNASRQSGLVIAEKQYLLLEKEATKLEAAAKKQQALSYSLESTARGFNVSAIASNAFKTALASIPFVAISVAISAVATALLSASKASETLESTLKASGEELKKLTFNQLQYRKELIEEELIKSRIELADAKARAAKKNANAEDKASRDEAIKNFEEQTKKLREIKQIQDDLSKPTISSTKTETTSQTETAKPTAISDELQNILDKSVLIKKKYAELRLELESSGKATAENIKTLADAENKEIEALSKKSNELTKKGNEEKLSQYLNYYEKIGEYAKLWQFEEQRIREENYLLKQDEINKLIELERAAFEAKANASGIEAAQTDISYEERKLQLQAESYEKEVALAELQYANNILNVENLAKTREEKDYLLALEYELYNATLERLRAEDEIANIEKVAEDRESMLDYQLSLIDAADSWGNSLEGVAGTIGNVIGAYNKMSKIALNSQKQQLKLDTNLAKTKEKYGAKSIEYIEAENKHIMDTSALKQEKQNAEIAGYANLAGAMASAFEQGSAGAIAFTTLQATLGIASSWTAIATAWALPFPSNIPAVAMVASAVMPIIAQLTSMGGSGGSGAGSNSYSVAEVNKFNIEAQYNPMIDKLDRQIELLEAIERNGSAGAIKVDLAAITFEKDYKLLANEFLTDIHNKLKSSWGAGTGARASNEKQFEDMLGFNLGDMVGGDFYIDKNSLKQDLNLMRLIETINANWDYFHNSGFGVLLDKDWKKAGDPMSMTVARIGQITNDMQELLHEYTMSLLDSMQDLKDAKEEYISIYEKLTDSRVFTDRKLADAFKSFDSLLSSGESYADYIYKEINNLQNLEKFLTNDKIEILLSQDPTNLKLQLDLLDELKRETGLTFQNGARDAIDFLESIKLVSEALVTSRNNINSFVESFMSDYDLLERQSQKLGTGIAKSFDELFLQFQTMASDVVGLTDEELSYLEATKSYLEEQNDKEIEAIEEQIDLQEKLLDTIKNNINTIEGIMNSLKSTIDKLRDSADATNTYTLNKFYESMSKTQELMKGKDYEAIAKSVQETIRYSSALSDSKNFTLTRDMQFAQLAAARQFEAMDITLQSEVDYLKEIEINTRDTVSRLEDMIEALGATIANAFDKNSQAIKNLIAELEKTKEKDGTAVSKLVDEIYTKYDLHKYQTDESGYEYWQNQVMSGALSATQLETAIKNSAQQILSSSSGGSSSSSGGGSTTSTSDLISSIYDKYNLTQYQTDSSGYDYWQGQVSSGAIAASDLESAIKAAADEILGTNSFAVGTTNVPKDMVAKIHQGEIITPKTYSEGIRNGDLMMGNVSSIESALDGISSSVNALVGIASSQLMQLKEIRDINNDSLVSLQNMEAII
ncbi:tape measure protein [Aliarcobacter cryaerophilus]|uniref:tape measure protein n=1 Tax=Aliarcobacter cryaerophilus TaxID=28198 RepID=UPI003DA6B974